MKEFFQIPSDADPPACGDHDFEALENNLAWRLIAARRPLQICSEIGVDEDHKDLHQDIDAFPYRIFHGNVDARILHCLKDCRLAPQVRLSEALSVQKAEDLEASFYRDTSYALAVSKITGDLIALLLTVNVKNVSGIFCSDMTLMEFVEVFTLVDNMPKCRSIGQTHPDSLQQIEGMGEIAALPLSALLSVHLLARDLYALTAGASIQTRDTGEEYTASWELPESLRSHLEELKEECPEVLAMICRLVARCVYLAVDLPVAILASEDDEPKDPHPLASLVKEMDIVDELEALCEGKGENVKQLLLQPVPADLKCWSPWKEGHVIAALKEYTTWWSQIRGPFLAAPTGTSVSMAADPAVDGGMVKGWVSVEWRQPTFGTASAKKATRMSAVAQEESHDSDSSDSDDDEWELISGTKTPDSAASAASAAPATQNNTSNTSNSIGAKGEVPRTQAAPALGSRPPVAQGVHQALELQGSDFVRDVLQRFMDSRRTRQSSRVVIRNEVAESLALAWENESDMGEVLESLLAVLGESLELEGRPVLVAQFREYFAKQQKRDNTPHNFGLPELSHLQRCILRAKSWTLQRSPSDGHCQFHAVGYAVNESHQRVRANALQWMKDHRADCEAFVLQDEKANKEHAFDEFLQGIAGIDWGNNLTLYALAHHYKREICVLTDNVINPWLRIEPTFGNPIHVVFYAELHYDAVQMRA